MNSTVDIMTPSCNHPNITITRGSYSQSTSTAPAISICAHGWYPSVMTKSVSHRNTEDQDQQRNCEGVLKIVDSFDKVLQILQAEEKATGMHFVGHRKEGIFDRLGSDMKAYIGEGRKHIRYSVSVGTKGRGFDPVPVEYTGVPFIEAGTYVLECHLGNDSGAWNKRRYAANRDRTKLVKRRIRSHDTKKMGCPAKVHIKRILKLPDFKIRQNTTAERDENRSRIISALKCDLDTVNFQPMYYILLPDLDNHKYHVVAFVAGVMVRKGKDRALHLHEIRKYLETGAYLPSVHINEKKGIRIAAKSFKLEDKLMYYIGKDGCEKRIVLYTDEQKQKVFDEYHILKSREHYDSAQTLYNLAERFYWTSMAEDVIAMITSCDYCRYKKRNNSLEYTYSHKKQLQGGSHHMVCELKRLKTPATIQRGSSSIKSNVTLKPECLPAGEIHNNFTNTTTSKAFLKSNYLPSSEKDNKLTSICDNIIHKSSTPVDVSGTRVQDTHLKGTLKVVDSYEEVLKLIIAEEKATGMHFVGHRKEGIFDRIGSDMKAYIGEGRKHIRYSVSVGTKGRGFDPVPVEYTGVPFIEAGTYVLECHLGNDSGAWNKRRYAANRDQMEEKKLMVTKRRILTQSTKKVGCPAKVHIKRILRMPDFKVKNNTTAERSRNRVRIIQALREDIESVNFQTVYYILLPQLESHKFHSVDIVAGVMVSKGEAGLLHLQQVRHYLETGTYLPSVPSKKKNGIRKSSKEFIIDGKTMYYIGKDGSQKRIVPLSENERQRAFQKCHALTSGYHCDRTETLQRLAKQFYWTSLIEDVCTKIDRCKTCESNKLIQHTHCYGKSVNTLHKAENQQTAMTEQAGVPSSTYLTPVTYEKENCDNEVVEEMPLVPASHQDSCHSYLKDQQVYQTTFGSIHQLEDGGHLVVIADDTLDLENWT
ncbi:uncharacterized protein LOC121854646 isoform X3 [Homarus americanus]|uniref:uncharacterized protein LOC121854646 isoform X3 n=1 Tax=Homarus americanus TaxID=6706 RepID=UPI001C46101B|nr:uncharacterized protein LOC121854646 isoform X3 [Homarus americanus]